MNSKKKRNSNVRRGIRICCVILLSPLLIAVPASAQATLDWSMVTWDDGDLSNSYILGNGVEISITVSTTALGTFINATPLVETPYIDGVGHTQNLFGTELDLGVIFNPFPMQGMSPVLIDIGFSEAVTDLIFDISDIDYSVGGGGEDDRLDQVVVTSNAGDPTLTPLMAGSATFTVAGNTATAISGQSADPLTDNGTVRVTFPDGVTDVTITYNEASGNNNPAGRGIGLLAMFTETPVDLQSFSIE
ncbi:MAG: hypothetical protein AAF657_10030 [Acidobacteriota bacterium]